MLGQLDVPLGIVRHIDIIISIGRGRVGAIVDNTRTWSGNDIDIAIGTCTIHTVWVSDTGYGLGLDVDLTRSVGDKLFNRYQFIGPVVSM
jgi:hypothetical protein